VEGKIRGSSRGQTAARARAAAAAEVRIMSGGGTFNGLFMAAAFSVRICYCRGQIHFGALTAQYDDQKSTTRRSGLDTADGLCGTAPYLFLAASIPTCANANCISIDWLFIDNLLLMAHLINDIISSTLIALPLQSTSSHTASPDTHSKLHPPST
jgi:hypothetical protein